MITRFVVTALIRNQENQILLCQMPENRGMYPGLWCLPGGGIEAGEDLETALRREVLEEVGLELEMFKPWYFGSDRHKKINRDGSVDDVYMVYHLYLADVASDVVTLNDEFEECLWVSPSEALALELNQPTRETMERYLSEVEVDAHQLWLKNPQGLIPVGTPCSKCGRYNSRNIVGHAVVLKNNQILLIKRKQNPMQGWWALPAGYLDWGEMMEECALRELKEEAGLDGKISKIVGIYSAPDRDEDGRQNVGVTYLVETSGEPSAGDDAEEVKWFPLTKLPSKIAFDHARMIADAINNF